MSRAVPPRELVTLAETLEVSPGPVFQSWPRLVRRLGESGAQAALRSFLVNESAARDRAVRHGTGCTHWWRL